MFVPSTNPYTTNLAHAVDASWTGSEIDITSLVGADAGSVTGAILEIHNVSGSDYQFGVRAVGSTDNILETLYNGKKCQMPVKIDSNDQCQVYLESAASFEVYLIAYTKTEAEWQTNWVALNPTSDGNFNSKDLSGYFTGNLECAFLVMRHILGGAMYVGAQRPGGADLYDSLFYNNMYGGACEAVSEAVELMCNNSATYEQIYLVGGIVDGYTAIATDTHSISTAGAWEENDLSGVVPDGAVAVLIQAHDGTAGDDPLNLDYRAEGEDTIDEYRAVHLGIPFICPINTSNRKIDVKAGSTTINYYTYGYFTEPASGTTATAAGVGAATATLNAQFQLSVTAAGAGAATATRGKIGGNATGRLINGGLIG